MPKAITAIILQVRKAPTIKHKALLQDQTLEQRLDKLLDA
jgi:hypothetical protein